MVVEPVMLNAAITIIKESIKNTGWSAREITTGLWPAIEEFLENNRNEWTLLARYTNNNGLTILKRTKQQ
jgi:hypothetical protein